MHARRRPRHHVLFIKELDNLKTGQILVVGHLTSWIANGAWDDGAQCLVA